MRIEMRPNTRSYANAAVTNPAGIDFAHVGAPVFSGGGSGQPRQSCPAPLLRYSNMAKKKIRQQPLDGKTFISGEEFQQVDLGADRMAASEDLALRCRPCEEQVPIVRGEAIPVKSVERNVGHTIPESNGKTRSIVEIRTSMGVATAEIAAV